MSFVVGNVNKTFKLLLFLKFEKIDIFVIGKDFQKKIYDFF